MSTADVPVFRASSCVNRLDNRSHFDKSKGVCKHCNQFRFHHYVYSTALSYSISCNGQREFQNDSLCS
jgi:hypothetical protein